MFRATTLIGLAATLVFTIAVWAPLPALDRVTALVAARNFAHGKNRSTEGVSVPSDPWAIGEQRRYRVETSGYLVVTGEDSREGKLETFAALQLELTPFERKRVTGGRTSTLVRAALTADKVQLTTNGAVRDITTQTREWLSQPFSFSVADTGVIEMLYLDPDMDPLTHSMVRGVISGLQFATPPKGSQETWSAVESEPSGRFVASYRRQSQPLKFEKRALRFLDLNGTGALLGTRKRDGGGNVELNANGIVADAQWTLDDVFSGGSSPMRGHRTLRLTLEDVRQVTADSLEVKQAWACTLDSTPRSKTAQRNYDELARGQDIPSLLRVAQRIDKSDTAQLSDLATKLEAVLRTQGKPALDAALAGVRGSANDDDARMLLNALAAANTPETQRALADLTADPKLSHTRRMAAVMQLGLNVTPTADTLKRMQDLAAAEAPTEEGDRELRDTSLLALGGALRNADPNDSSVRGAVGASMQFLLEQEKHATTLQERLLAVDALGNTGNAEALPALIAVINDESAGHIRGSAVLGLRFAQDPQTDQLIADTALSDQDPMVRSDALSTLLYRELTTQSRSAVVDALHHDDDPVVRMHAVDVASRHSATDDALTGALAWTSQHDPDERVRGMALRSLNPSKSQ